MKNNTGSLPAICLGGPTGSGKTAAALKLARIWNCEIVNADSRQLYKDFPIITAQPDKKERSGIPHHLYGLLSTNEKCTAAEWIDLARESMVKILEKGKIPLLVGGTGFYIKAIFEGLSAIPPADPSISSQIIERMRELGSRALYAELAGIDPDTARKIHPNDKQRICRGLEVFHSTKKTLYWWHKNAAKTSIATGPVFWLAPQLKNLEPILIKRIWQMLDKGAQEEVKMALKNFADFAFPGWESIGARELASYLLNKTSLDDCVKRWFELTRAYAKRQLTWFRGQNKWHPFINSDALLEFAENNKNLPENLVC